MKAVIQTKQPGFTLLEVLLGMSIMSIMMLLLFASLRICVQNWNAGEKKIAVVSEAAIVQGFLRNKLQATLPLDAEFFEEPQFSFQGDKQTLQFVASMPASASRLGLQLFKLSLKKAQGKDGQELLVDIQPFFPQGADDEQWSEEQVVILENIHRLKFAYFGSEDEGFRADDASWNDEWLERDSLPRLVSIDVELTSGEVWPQLVVALKIDKAIGSGNSGSGSKRNAMGIVNGVFVNP